MPYKIGMKSDNAVKMDIKAKLRLVKLDEYKRYFFQYDVAMALLMDLSILRK